MRGSSRARRGRPVAEHRPPHDLGAELADVARPGIAAEGGERLALGHQGQLPHLAEEVGDEQWHIARPLSQRRDPQRRPPQPIVEVLAEGPLPHHGGEVAVGGGEQPGAERHG